MMKTLSDVLVDAVGRLRYLKDADYLLIGTEATMSLLARSGIEPRPGLRRLVGRMGADGRCPGRTGLAA
jgi:hypothetical protein